MAPWHPEFPRIETPRLILDEIAETDFEAFAQIYADPRVSEHFGFEMKDPSQAKKFFQAWRSRFHEGRGIRWAVREKVTAKLIGTFGIAVAKDVPGAHEAGLQIGADHWRQGLGTEASQAAVKWIQSHQKAKMLVGWVATTNQPTRGLLTRYGFKEDGTSKTEHGLTLLLYRLEL